MSAASAVRPRTSSDPQCLGGEWWRGAVIYQIYPRSFCDRNGDGVGDLPGVLQQLDHVAALGADAIWISPFFRSPMKDFGYDVADYRQVDPLFGTLEDFDAVLAHAHALGLKVLIDQVLSHTSDQHEWFQSSRSRRDHALADWYVWADARPDGTPPNNWLSVFGGPAWSWDARRRQYYLHQFLASQPDLNFHHPAVQDQVLAEVEFWCARGVDGFRFDACNHQFSDARLRNNPPAAPDSRVSTVQSDNPYAMQCHRYDKSRPENLAFLQRLRRLLDRYGAVAMGEVGDEDATPLMAQYTAAGQRLHMAYSFALLTRDGSAQHIQREVEDLTSALARTGGWGCWAFSNHDSERVATRWAVPERNGQRLPQPAQCKLLWALLSALRGSVCVYQGEELGLPQAEVPYEWLQDPYGKAFWPEFKGRDGCRTPMPWRAAAPHAGFSTAASEQRPWLPMPEAHLALAVDRQHADPDSMLAFARHWLAWRRQQPLLRWGDIQFHPAPEGVLLFERRAPAPAAAEHGLPARRAAAQAESEPPSQNARPALLLAFNLSDAPATLTLPATPRAHVWQDITPDFARSASAASRPPASDRSARRLAPYGLWVGLLVASDTEAAHMKQWGL